jgi:hypothetical protein
VVLKFNAMGIRTKIMMGFVILASMLFISGAISIFELTKLGKAVKGLIFDNYKSIDYSRNMLDALELQENAILFYTKGDTDQAKAKFSKAHSLFTQNLDSASINLNQSKELVYIDSVRLAYNEFYQSANDFFLSADVSLKFYLETINPKITVTSEHVKNLITINQKSLFDSAAYLETSAQRAVMPGLIVIITSLLFTFIFTYLVHYYFVKPIIRLTKGINDFVKYRKTFDVPIENKDELLSLRESIVSLISIVKTLSRKAE